ncbi:centrosomal protein of 162 kDa [Anoplophora glabripennis]|uniref:centrosomal protein of 162 kDa n=1 Tax=Anoplophora glabripennis TaxID=217634 RepID=UPI000873752F|nr:centrosomal protein of 162 kDa [Anoplophora glabripennis]
METKTASSFWWLKSAPLTTEIQDSENNLVVPKLDLHSSSSIANLLDKDKNSNCDSEVDVGSIIEEINRVAAQSPLGPYEKSVGDRSIDDIMKEAERIYMESSKSFEQLSQRSKTSQNISDLLSNMSKDSTPTPKSVSPLPIDPDPEYNSESDDDEYTTDFSEESKVESNPSPIEKTDNQKFTDFDEANKNTLPSKESKVVSSEDEVKSVKETVEDERSLSISKSNLSVKNVPISQQGSVNNTFEKSENFLDVVTTEKSKQVLVSDIDSERLQRLNEVINLKNDLIRTLEDDNKSLKSDIHEVKLELQKTRELLERTATALNAKTVSSPEINLELEKALEHLKDSKEINTALQLQLDAVNKTHQLLKSSYDDLATSNKNLERRVVELDSTLDKYKNELLNLQKTKDKLLENEVSLNKLLEIEKLQSKSLKLQNEKDAKCIQDLNRQIKEMERIIARKHPDSVSALIVAAKENATDSNLTARKILEDRIKTLEQEQLNRETQSSKVFLEIQEKFNQMKSKYENHIEDLELHVSDLKAQLKRKTDTYDVYTQTIFDEKIPQKETFTVFTQTDAIPTKPPKIVPVNKPQRINESIKEDAHLLATIRGLQTDLANKEKVVTRLQKEIEDLRKTNRRLQKEREGSLRSLSDKREFRSYPEKLALQSRSSSISSEKDFRKDEELQQLKAERDKLKQQLSRLEQDYQSLKTKRIHDLTALQEAHEREVSNYVASVTPLREQLEVQQVSIAALQSQLNAAKQELAVVTVERDHLNNRLLNAPFDIARPNREGDNAVEVEALLKKIAFLEKRYEEREYRLRAIVHSLAQKTVTNRSCEQCAERQQQLITYKVELDQLLATVRALQ